jgi:hypothetical protein
MDDGTIIGAVVADVADEDYYYYYYYYYYC